MVGKITHVITTCVSFFIRHLTLRTHRDIVVANIIKSFMDFSKPKWTPIQYSWWFVYSFLLFYCVYKFIKIIILKRRDTLWHFELGCLVKWSKTKENINPNYSIIIFTRLKVVDEIKTSKLFEISVNMNLAIT